MMWVCDDFDELYRFVDRNIVEWKNFRIDLIRWLFSYAHGVEREKFLLIFITW